MTEHENALAIRVSFDRTKFKQVLSLVPEGIASDQITIYGGISYEDEGHPFVMFRVFVTTESFELFNTVSSLMHRMEYDWIRAHPEGPYIQAWSTQLPFVRIDGIEINTPEEAIKHSEYPGEFMRIYPPEVGILPDDK